MIGQLIGPGQIIDPGRDLDTEGIRAALKGRWEESAVRTARRVGLNPSTLTRYVNGQRTLSAKTEEKLRQEITRMSEYQMMIRGREYEARLRRELRQEIREELIAERDWERNHLWAEFKFALLNILEFIDNTYPDIVESNEKEVSK